jgi:hypothetical protein
MPDAALLYAINAEQLREIEEFEDYFEVTPELLLFRLCYVKKPDFLNIDSLLQREERHMLKLAEMLADNGL